MLALTYSVLLETNAQAAGDTLIDWKAQATIRIAVFVLLLAGAGVVGIISRRVEHAVVFALATSLIAMAFFIIH
ncbi:hypothetical protein [Kamptonema formosum]|uniref:hypothetical protein n=1 Tax=Kamptonema formosum TaxID=331992 RepID=UPI00034D4C58|nr:hypothetical protein [Oscillatoria sp. PCC 10802]